MKTRIELWQLRIRRRLRAFVWLVLLVSLAGLGMTGYRLYQTYQVTASGRQLYRALKAEVGEAAGEADVQDPPTAVLGDPNAETSLPSPDWRPDLAKLRGIYPDTIAWLYAPDTDLSYPVMQAADYDYYLRHFPDGTYNLNGTPFLDYHCAPDFSGRLNIIYGHNMQTGDMFGSLEGYKDQAYADEHPYLYLFTPQEDYVIEALYGAVIEAGEWRERAFMYDVNLDSFLAYGKANTTFTTKAKAESQDRLLVLSTCSYEFDDARYVLIGKMQPFMK